MVILGRSNEEDLKLTNQNNGPTHHLTAVRIKQPANGSFFEPIPAKFEETTCDESNRVMVETKEIERLFRVYDFLLPNRLGFSRN